MREKLNIHNSKLKEIKENHLFVINVFFLVFSGKSKQVDWRFQRLAHTARSYFRLLLRITAIAREIG